MRGILSGLLIFCLSSYAWSWPHKKPQIDQLELQEDVQRFYTRFTERVAESFMNSNLVKDVKTREEALRQYLIYDSEALKISTGPYPELNLLDMLVFIKLNKRVLKKYWIPKSWKSDGWPIFKAFSDSELDLEGLALGIVSPKELRVVDQLVVDWIKENPNSYRVEKIRLSNFSKFASESKNSKSSQGFSLSNILVDTKSAVKAVDQMVLVANRSIFLAQYMPTLLRTQVRLGTGEILDDVFMRISQSDKLVENLSEVRPVLISVSELTRNLDILTRDAGELLKTYRKEFPPGRNLREVHGIVEKSNEILDKLKVLKSGDSDLIKTMKKELRAMLLYIALLAMLVGLVISVVWWSGSYIVRKRLEKSHDKL